MSRRVYVKEMPAPHERQEVIIESIGESTKKTTEDGEDIWNVTVQLDGDFSLTSILWTSQCKELIAQLEAKNWKKEGGDGKQQS